MTVLMLVKCIRWFLLQLYLVIDIHYPRSCRASDTLPGHGQSVLSLVDEPHLRNHSHTWETTPALIYVVDLFRQHTSDQRSVDSTAAQSQQWFLVSIAVNIHSIAYYMSHCVTCIIGAITNTPRDEYSYQSGGNVFTNTFFPWKLLLARVLIYTYQYDIVYRVLFLPILFSSAWHSCILYIYILYI